jgi:hypothetical protein
MSLFIHDRLYATDYKRAYAAWKSWTRNHLDPGTGMPAGHLESDTGRLVEPARGCANSWMLALLPQMEPEFAGQQYGLYKKHFLVQRLGFSMFREYPHGIDMPADVDSGPIVWGAGVTATGTGLAAALANGDLATARDIHDLAAMFGWPRFIEVEGQKGRQYLLGALPVGDAFLAWAYSIEVKQQPSPAPAWRELLQKRGSFYAAAVLCFALLACRGVLFYRTIRRRLHHAAA